MSMTTFEAYGTSWPVPASWQQTEPGVFQGEDGMSKVFMDDHGELIDPGRCERAESRQPAAWKLVRTRNGIAVTGRYLQSGARVLIYGVRPDVRDLPAGTFELPEVQVTNVFTKAPSDELVRRVRELIDERSVEPREYGQLDAYGHSAQRVKELLTSEVARKGLTIETAAEARVWQCPIDRRGVSYTARDPSGRVAFLGAVWSDGLGQTWRLHYWFHPEHGRQAERVLSQCCEAREALPSSHSVTQTDRHACV